MANWSDPQMGATAHPTTTAGRDLAYDAGLRAHMLSVYNYMTSGILLTGIVALLFAQGGANSMAYQMMAGGGILAWIDHARAARDRHGAELRHQPASRPARRRSCSGCSRWSWACRCRRSSSSTPARLDRHRPSSRRRRRFASLSLWGYTTKKDLSAMGTFLRHGPVRPDRGDADQPVLAESGVRSRDQRNRRADLRRPHRL